MRLVIVEWYFQFRYFFLPFSFGPNDRSEKVFFALENVLDVFFGKYPLARLGEFWYTIVQIVCSGVAQR